MLARRSWLSLVVALLACGAPRDPVQALLDDLVAAVEARDAAKVVDRLAEGFQGTAGLTRTEARATLQRYFAGYDGVDLTLYDVKPEGQEHVRLGVQFSGRPRNVAGLAGLLPTSADYRFELTLSSLDGRLVVSSASWEPWRPEER